MDAMDRSGATNGMHELIVMPKRDSQRLKGETYGQSEEGDRFAICLTKRIPLPAEREERNA